MTIDCPNCKLAFPDTAPQVCPRCGWDLHTEAQQTMPPSVETSDGLDDFIIATPAESSPSPMASDTTPTIDLPTIKGPDPVATSSPSEKSPSSTPPDAETANPDRNLSQTLPSVRQSVLQGSASLENEPTLISPSGKAPLTVPEQSQRSIKTVIPPRTISKNIQPGRLQDYKLGKRIGSGSFGVVFQAIQVPLDRAVALKVLTSGDSANDEQRERIQTEFLREAQFTGRLEHPNIVPVHDIGLTIDEKSDTARPFYVMKEIHGVSWLKKIGKLSRAENLEIFNRVVDAIGFAHAKNILHCDLKPENVMLGEFGEVLVVDWGQAVDLTDPESVRPGGTPAYISPEMATFWCDIYLDRQPDSPARSLVGPRSDVYLLGAILLEMVTGKLPRTAIEDESQFDVMRRACHNDISVAEWPENDELIQIARRALRKSDSDHIESIADLHIALQEFENRALSIELRERADQLLTHAKSQNSYDDFQKSRFGYEESLEKWPENSAATRGLHDARLSCATLALSDQNFDLGIDMLAHPDTTSEKELKTLLVSGKRKRDRRKKLVRWLALGLTASILAGIVINAIMIKLNFDSRKLRDQALAEKAQIENEIEPLRSELLNSQATIVANEKQIEQFPLRLAQEQQKFQGALNEKKSQFESELNSERDSFAKRLSAAQLASEKNLATERHKLDTQLQAEREKFAQQKTNLTIEVEELADEVSNLNESSMVLRNKSTFTNILQKLDAGNYQAARALLNAVPNKETWEWSRFNLLAHREVESVYPTNSLNAACASHDGRLLGLVYDDRIEVRRSQFLTGIPIVIPAENVQSLALSSDGKRLAAGMIQRSGEPRGTIAVFDLSDPTRPRPIKQLNAPSRSITHLEFSHNDQRLLAVGQPSKIRKNVDQESELMVWSSDWEPQKIYLAGPQGALPSFTFASFSSDGSKILTTNPHGLSRDQFVHLYSHSEQGFRWTSRSPTAGINCASFLDDRGNEIVGCARDAQANTFSLVSWYPKNTPGASSVRKSPNIIERSSADDQSTMFVNLENANPDSQFTTVIPVDNKVLSIWRSGDWIVSAGEDRQTTLWDWNTKSASSYRGHSRKIDFCTLISGPLLNENILISVSLNAKPEILKTDLSTWQPETITRKIAKTESNDSPSPTTYFRSLQTGHLAIGNDQGLAAIQLNPPTESVKTNTVEGDRESIQWEVSAWKKHFLTDQFLFAQSRSDLFYKYDRATGDLKSVITQLASKTVRSKDLPPRGEIVEFDVSADGKRAVVVTSQDLPEFEIWDLENQTLIRTVNYANQNIFGPDSDKKLLLVKISPDGKWIVGGKVGLFAWSVDTGQPLELFQSPTQSARTSVSDIRFLPGSSELLASWKGRIDLLDLKADRPAQTFNIDRLRFSENEPAVVDTLIDNNQILVLAHSTATNQSAAGIMLLDLTGESILHEFPGADSATFSRQNNSDILVLRDEQKQSAVQRYNFITQNSNPVPLETLTKALPRFQSCQRINESADGDLIVQALTLNPINPIRSNWNSISLKPDLSLGRLAVLAKPPIQFFALADDNAITLDSGKLRFWKYRTDGVRPNGVFPHRVNACQLSPDGKRLALIPAAADRVVLVSPHDGKVIDQIRHFRVGQPNENTLPQDSTPNEPVSVTAIQWSANSESLFTGNTWGEVEIWNVSGTNPRQFGFIAASKLPKINAPFPSNNLDSMHPITELRLSATGTALLTRYQNVGALRVSHLDDDQWTSFLIQHEDNQRIVAGDISTDGNRVVTGSDRGRLTIWNVETLIATENSAQNSLFEYGTEREIFNFDEMHQSSIRFVRFTDNEAGDSQVISAEENDGDNQYLIWPVKPED